MEYVILKNIALVEQVEGSTATLIALVGEMPKHEEAPPARPPEGGADVTDELVKYRVTRTKQAAGMSRQHNTSQRFAKATDSPERESQVVETPSSASFSTSPIHMVMSCGLA